MCRIYSDKLPPSFPRRRFQDGEGFSMKLYKVTLLADEREELEAIAS